MAKPFPKELRKRCTHSPEFKARVAMESISGRKTIQEIAADHALHPELSVSRHCALLGLPRSTLHYQPTPVRVATLRIMARIDAHDLEGPY